MDQAEIVRRGEGAARLHADAHRVLQRERCDQRERQSLDVLDGGEAAPFGLADVEDADDVRMREARIVDVVRVGEPPQAHDAIELGVAREPVLERLVAARRSLLLPVAVAVPMAVRRVRMRVPMRAGRRRGRRGGRRAADPLG